jgi:ribosome biogenesis GTPase
LALCFPEFRAAVEQCRFPDCLHTVEPECAVRAAVETGQIDLDRYESYRALLKELLAAPRKWE